MSVDLSAWLSAVILEPLDAPLEIEGWRVVPMHSRVYQATDPTGQPYALKAYASEASAKREFGVLGALRHFGINLAPEPLALAGNKALLSWLPGVGLAKPPAPAEEEMWQRMMAAFGAAGELHLLDYSKQVPMRGTGFQNPDDVLNAIAEELEKIDQNAPIYDTLAGLLMTLVERIAPKWHLAPTLGLCRRNYGLKDLLWDGHHLVTVDWAAADWGDVAAEVGFWSAHPDYEDVPASHWAWVRWEFARLTRDAEGVPRATLYAQLAQVWWAVHLSATPAAAKLRDRYLARAQKIFK